MTTNEPKFHVGDMVFWRQDVENWRRMIKPSRDAHLAQAKEKHYLSLGDLVSRLPPAFQILEITTQTCYGGTQVQYQFRKSDGTTFTLTEPELIASYEDEDATP